MSKKPLLALAAPALAAIVALAAGGPAATAAPSATAASSSCATSKLALHTAGQLTVATDSPGLPALLREQQAGQRQGLRERGRVRDRQAARLRARARSSGSVEPFDSSYAPGPKSFDFDINEISITPARAKEVVVLGAVLHEPAGDHRLQRLAAGARDKSLAAFKNAKIGVQIGTTSLDAVDAGDQADQAAAGLQHLQRRRQRVQDPPRRRDRRRPRDGVLPDRGGADPARNDRRPVQRAGRRQLGRAAEQGLDADGRA